MTAKEVNGLRVVDEETPKSPLWTEKRPMYYTHSRLLMLEDGSTIYGCAYGECDYTDEKLGRIRAHQGYNCEHRDPARPAPRRRGSKTEAEHFAKAVSKGEEEFSPDIAELLAFLGGANPDQEEAHRKEVQRLQKLVRTWKKRAIEAEAALNLIKKSFHALRK